MTLFITPAHAEDAPAAPAADAGHDAAPAADATHSEVGHEAPGGHGGVFPPFDTTTFASQLFWLVLTFGLLYRVISKVAAPRIAGILETRAARIQADLSEAERARAESEAAVAAYEKDLAEARKKAATIAAETRDKVNRDLDARRKAVEADLSARLATAETEISAIKAKAMGEVDAVAGDTAEAIVSALIGQSDAGAAAAAVAAIRKV